MTFPVRKADPPLISAAIRHPGVIYEGHKIDCDGLVAAFRERQVVGTIMRQGKGWDVVVLKGGHQRHASSHGVYVMALVGLQEALSAAGAVASTAPLLQ